ncbi:hypothetical protein GR223_23435 [Rhizobium leguminosarum]|uniref:hypothetical protein n=1 Tax=Rhizobium ruizarguesonis TaxID=2081791 RepID=UPI0013BAE5D0|nr:hypothetical protein [Rhizobium ruizarguesonis]NEJ88850.1 hypothetical protein [Rhizobium ruizarguesonis]NEK40682.1 hypothetical protein [Rhizobium leguminosarum]
MTLAHAIVLQSPIYDSARLGALVERCLTDGVGLIAISGKNAFKLEAEIDWMIIGDGSKPERFICTSAHCDGDNEWGIEDALCIASSFRTNDGPVDRVFLLGRTWLKYRSPKS